MGFNRLFIKLKRLLFWSLNFLLVSTVMSVIIFYTSLFTSVRTEIVLNWPILHKFVVILLTTNSNMVVFSHLAWIVARAIHYYSYKFFLMLWVESVKLLGSSIELLRTKYSEFSDWFVMSVDSTARALGFGDPEVVRWPLAIGLLYFSFRLLSYLWRFRSKEMRPYTSLRKCVCVILEFGLGGPPTAVHRWRLSIRRLIHYVTALAFLIAWFFASLTLTYCLGLLTQSGFDIFAGADAAARYALGLVKETASWVLVLSGNVRRLYLTRLVPLGGLFDRILDLYIPKLSGLFSEFNRLVDKFVLPDLNKFVLYLSRNLPGLVILFLYYYYAMSRELVKPAAPYVSDRRSILLSLILRLLVLFIIYCIIRSLLP